MDDAEKYRYRRDHHLCVKCGEELPQDQKLKMCDVCRQFTRIRQNQRRAEKSEEWKTAKREYMRKWWAEHPERVKIYRERRKAET